MVSNPFVTIRSLFFWFMAERFASSSVNKSNSCVSRGCQHPTERPPQRAVSPPSFFGKRLHHGPWVEHLPGPMEGMSKLIQFQKDVAGVWFKFLYVFFSPLTSFSPSHPSLITLTASKFCIALCCLPAPSGQQRRWRCPASKLRRAH